MGREDVSDEMRGVTNGKVLAFGGVVVQLPIFGLKLKFVELEPI